MVNVVSARVDEETHRKMKKFSHINWSDIIRKAIQEKIREEETCKREINIADVEEALYLMDSVRRAHPGFDSVKEIRNQRELRR